MDSSSKLHSTNTTKPMGELASTNTEKSIDIGSSMSSFSSSSRVRSKEMENLSFEIRRYPSDLLHRFVGSSSSRSGLKDPVMNMVGDEDDDDDVGGLNLGLGLSSGGIFGVDKSSNRGLIRSSSIAGTMPLFRDEETVVVPPATPLQRGVSSLVRSSSLPVETEEEWRKRKEMQTLRRMEAKRRRSEKQRVLKESTGAGVGVGGEEKSVESLKFRGRLEREQQTLGITNKFIGSSMGSLFGSSTPPPPPPTNVEVKGRRTTFGSLQGFLMAQAQVQQGSSQGSGDSQGGTSSELESKTHQGSSSGEAKSPASIQSLQERSGLEAAVSPGTKGDSSQRGGRGPEAESSMKQPDATESKRRDTASSGIEDMPCVFTIGDGPNGRKVEGILYKYGKGEGVRIMCVCHGTFYSPADFVKHAGGRDVEHPLRHIVVSPSSTF